MLRVAAQSLRPGIFMPFCEECLLEYSQILCI